MALRPGLLLAAAALTAGSATPVQRHEVPTAVQVITQIDIARANPAGYADLLRDLAPRFRGNIYRDKDIPDGLITNEGMAAVNDAATWISGRSALPPVEPSDLLSAAARVHVLEQGPLGTTGHFSPDGSGPGARLKKLGGDMFVAETITYGASTAEAVVRQLAVDDGVRDRGHRHILFSPEYRYAGAACGPHKVYGTMCVVEFARTPNGAP
jgi:uncharacterized protein YkwD